MKIQWPLEDKKQFSSVVGEVPILYKVQYKDWDKKKEDVLKHIIHRMEKKNNKNTIALLILKTLKDIG